jgi:hypothetical protein
MERITNMKNKGKIFEGDFKDSCKEEEFLIRLKDEAQSFKKSAKFSNENPCDYLLFDTVNRNFHCLELKTTKSGRVSFADIFHENGADGMIHKHQIMSLAKFSKYNHVECGLVLNFRNENGNEKEWTQRTFYISIGNFIKHITGSKKRSVNINDLLDANAIEIEGRKKRTHYEWNVRDMLNRIACE